MATKKVVIVGEMHNDLVYRCDFFKVLEDQLAEKIAHDKTELGSMQKEDIRKVIHGVIAALPKKNPGEALSSAVAMVTTRPSCSQNWESRSSS